MFASIPSEMRQYPQWVVWRFEESDGAKPTKVPYDVKTGRMASVNDPRTWADYNTCVLAATAQGSHYNGIGFVLTRDDPYSIIDLDDTGGNPDQLREQIKIFEAFDSYSERSVSKTGLHIIVKGSVPSGRRRNKVELYHSERFMIMTGDVFEAKPIAERQELLSQMWHEMGGGKAAAMYDGDSPQTLTDEEVIDKALRAVNGPKFEKLHTGAWQDLYQSQSEADFAYVDILAFYTQNREQLKRLFRASPLGQREKAQRDDYVAYMVNKSFDRMLPPVRFDSVYNAIEQELAKARAGAVAVAETPAEVIERAKVELPPPPGLMGEIAQFIYNAAPRPVPEIALVGAIGYMAGIAGRAYNVSGTGLNQYVMLLAPTGTGKEGIARGVSRLAAAVSDITPKGNEHVGPGEIASGQALIKELGRRMPSFVSILGEIGLRLKSMSGDYVSPADNMLKRAWLDLYNKSGKNDLLQPSIYSDKDKGTGQILAPAFSMIGESTPETFYGNLTESMISDGLLPRFTIVEYIGKRPRRNDSAVYAQPSPELIQKLKTLCVIANDLNSKNDVRHVATDPMAQEYLDEFDRFCDDQINASDRDVVRQLWNRAHLKVLKLSALIAVGVNPGVPIITLVEAEWARTQVERDIRNLLARFEAGSFGMAHSDTAEDKQVQAVIRKIQAYVSGEYTEVAYKYGVSVEMHRDKVVPYVLLQRTLAATVAFAKDKAGASRALQRSIQTLIDNGDLQEVGKREMQERFGFGGKAYVITNVRIVHK